tara:strand:- start:5881 stop:6666 length:786 start_codon:yes stop_codon:yes gene_type:complete
MKIGVRIFLGLALTLILPLLSAVAVAADLPALIESVRNSVVGIGTAMPPRPSSSVIAVTRFSGTGFVVGDGRQIITNYHVIPQDLNIERKETLAIFTGRGKTAKVRSAKIVATDPTHDLVLLRVEGSPLPAMTLSNGEYVMEGAGVAFTGFPIGVVLGLYPVTHRGIVSAITPIVIPAMSSKTLSAQQIKSMRNPFDVYQLDATAYPGNSGSAVYELETGKVIGVLNSVFVKGTKESALESPSGISYAIPVKYVNQLMNRR